MQSFNIRKCLNVCKLNTELMERGRMRAMMGDMLVRNKVMHTDNVIGFVIFDIRTLFDANLFGG